MDVYDRITAELKHLDKTRKDLCNDTGISYDTLSGLFKRKSGSMKIDMLTKIAAYLDVSVDWLLEGGDKEQKNNDVIEQEIALLSKRLSLKNKAKVLLFINDLLEGKGD